MKRSWSVILILLVFLLSACSQKQPAEKETETGTAAASQTANETHTDPAEDQPVTPPEDQPGTPPEEDDGSTVEAVYLGIKDYGAPETNRSNLNNFKYRFKVGDEEKIFSVDNGTKDENGEYDYPIQNILKENYKYVITLDSDTVIKAEPISEAGAGGSPKYDPPVSGTPGQLTVKNLLMTALAPAGRTLYIYGGGWNWQDVGASNQVKSIGVSEDWFRFFESQDATFTYRDKDGKDENKDPANSYYPYGEYNEYYYAGLDCSGYVSWVINNTLNKDRVETDYFSGATKLAKSLANRGLGEWTRDTDTIKAGDIVSISGHVWISLGQCSDGSILIVHSTPSYSRAGQPGGGVQISAIGTSEDCEAYKLADKYMSEYYKDWYSRYPVKLCDPEVYKVFSGDNAGIFGWNTEDNGAGLSDPEGLCGKSAKDVMIEIFGK